MATKLLQRDTLLTFKCPGCKREHHVQHGAPDGPNWDWNGSTDAPTLTPSVLVTYEGADAGQNGAPPAVCHSFVAVGRIQFLGDCTHDKAGQTVDLPDLEVI